MANLSQYIADIVRRRLSTLTKRRGAFRLPKPSRPRHPKTIQNTYFNDLKSMLSVMESILNRIIREKGESVLHASQQLRPKTDSLHMDDYSDDIKDIISKARLQFEAEVNPKIRNKTIAYKAALSINQFNKNDTQRVFKSVLGVDPFISEPWLEQELKAFVADNVSYITSIEDSFFDRIEDTIFRAARSGETLEGLSDQLQRDYDITESKAAFIARDQVSKFNGQLTMLRQQSLGIKKYEWSTSLDERVRDSHAEKEGKIFEWSNPPSDTGNPGEDFNCRCVALPVFEDEEQESSSEE